MKITCISDLHGHFPELPGGDLLIVAGDLTARHTSDEFLLFCSWADDQEYSKVVVIGGNHDEFLVHKDFKTISDTMNPLVYLCDSGYEFEGVKIWGSPWTKTFPGMNPNCKAFTCDSEEELYDKYFDKFPVDTDILITHSPPHRVLDKTSGGIHAGSRALYGWLNWVDRPRLHCFGHIHEGYGMVEKFASYNDTMMKSVNASHVNEFYKPVNPPINLEMDFPKREL